MSNNRLHIEPGKKYGQLLPIRQVGKNKFGCVQWLCKCDCGIEKIVTSYNLYHGFTLHCGCKTNRTWYEDRTIPARNVIYSNYKSYANSKKIEFSLNREEFFKLCDACCYYCGSAPSTIKATYNRINPSIYVYNGIDRIDSSKGYNIKNVVPCCKKCNFAKSNRFVSDFIAWARQLGLHLQSATNPVIREAYLKVKQDFSG